MLEFGLNREAAIDPKQPVVGSAGIAGVGWVKAKVWES
jgi:hypothetical protein